MIGPGRKTLASLDIRGIPNIAHVISTLYDKQGVPSALHDYCNDAVRRGYSKFVLVAVQLGKSWFASGVHQRDPEGCQVSKKFEPGTMHSLAIGVVSYRSSLNFI
jgi:hypothetical protein